MRTRSLLVLTTALAAICAAHAAEKYSLKISAPEKVGDRSRISKTESLRVENAVLDESGQAVDSEKHADERSATYVETILEIAEKKNTRLTRKYESAVHKEDGEAKELNLNGKTVVCELKDGKYRFTLEGGGKLTNAAVDLLENDFKNKVDDRDLDKLFLPTSPAAVGESWKCDVPGIVKLMLDDLGEDAIDVKKSTAVGTLRKVYPKDGHTFGVIEVKLDLPLLKFGEAGDMIKTDPGSKMSMTFTLDVCIDGTQTAGTMKAVLSAAVVGTVDSGGQKIKIKVNVNGEFTETQTPVK